MILTDCFFPYPTIDQLIERVERSIDSNCSFFIAKIDSGIVGVLIAKQVKQGFFTIEAIAVKESLRNTTIGSKLLQLFIQLKEPNRIQLETDNEAVGFYLKNGFEIIKTELKYDSCVRITLAWG